MTTEQWLRNWLAQPRRGSTRRLGVAPRLEVLEDRTLPSTFTVANLNDSGAGSLRAAVASADASPGSTIDFAHGLHGTITLYSGELDISANTTINGPGANKLAISGNNSSRVFEIGTGQNASISGLTIANGLAVQGGGVDNFGTLSVSNCTLLNNQAVGGSGASTTSNAANGGGIANEVGGSLTLTDSLLKGNVAAASAGNDAFGGAVLNLGSTTVTGCTFTGDEATGGGSSSYYDGSYGGAIENFGFPPSQLYGATLTVSDSTFSDNEATSATGFTFGDAAAIDVEFNTVATFTNCTFTGNVGAAGAGGDGQGGAIFAEFCTLTFTNCGFIGNQAIGGNDSPADLLAGQGIGGAIEVAGASASMTGCTLIGNKALGGSGGANPTVGNLSGSSEYGAGGGIQLIAGATMTISNSLLIGNVAQGGSSIAGTGGAASGGGIEDANGIGGSSSSLTLSNSVLIGNQALGGAGGSGVAGGVAFGGGLDLSFSSAATVTNTAFALNSAKGGGGGAGANGGNGSGGAISAAIQSYFGFPDTSSLSLSNSTLIGNSAQGGAGGAGANGGDGLGGGVFVGPGGTANLNQSSIVFNLALGGNGGSGGADGTGIGGGVYNLGTLNLVGTSILHNHASTSNNDLFG